MITHQTLSKLFTFKTEGFLLKNKTSYAVPNKMPLCFVPFTLKKTSFKSYLTRHNEQKTLFFSNNLKQSLYLKSKYLRKSFFSFTKHDAHRNQTQWNKPAKRKNLFRNDEAVSLVWEPYLRLTKASKVTIVTHNMYDSYEIEHLDKQIREVLQEFRFITLNRQAIKIVTAVQLLIKFKNTKSLAKAIQEIFQSAHYTKHLSYFPLIWYLVSFIIGPQLQKHNCLGVKIQFKGKLGVGGDSRKTTQRFYHGVTSSSSKFVKLNRTFLPIRTKTGAIGLSVTVGW